MLSREERETIINFNEADKTASIYTHSAALKRKLDALAASRPGECKKTRLFPDGGAEYETPKKWVRVNASRVLTDAQRESLAARGATLASNLTQFSR